MGWSPHRELVVRDALVKARLCQRRATEKVRVAEGAAVRKAPLLGKWDVSQRRPKSSSDSPGTNVLVVFSVLRNGLLHVKYGMTIARPAII